jgi:hypothetical protein
MSVGLEVLALENLRFGGRYELRMDRMVEAPPGQVTQMEAETVQAVISNGVSWQITPEVTTLGTVRLAFTQNLSTRDIIRDSVEASVAALWRPRNMNWFKLSGRYTRMHRRWNSIAPILQSRDRADLVAATAMFDLAVGLRFTERLLFKHRVRNGVDAGTTDEVIWITHAAMTIIDNLDLAHEYRLWMTFAGDVGHGLLTELGYTLAKSARIGIGYDFSSVPRDLSLHADSDAGGLYARITGTY